MHAAMEGLSENTPWPDITARRQSLWNDQSEGDIRFVLELLYMRCSRAFFWGQTCRRSNAVWARGLGRGLRVGYTGVCITHNVEPLCTNFSAEFLESSCSEAISGVFSPCWCGLVWLLQVMMVSASDKGEETLLKQHPGNSGNCI